MGDSRICCLFAVITSDDINTIHLQISVAADALPPTDVRQVPVVVVDAPDVTCDSNGASTSRTPSTRGHNLDLTLRKVGKFC